METTAWWSSHRSSRTYHHLSRQKKDDVFSKSDFIVRVLTPLHSTTQSIHPHLTAEKFWLTPPLISSLEMKLRKLATSHGKTKQWRPLTHPQEHTVEAPQACPSPDPPGGDVPPAAAGGAGASRSTSLGARSSAADSSPHKVRLLSAQHRI